MFTLAPRFGPILALVLLWPCGGFASSTNNFDPEALAYNLKTTVGSYEKYGRRNPKWDEDAKECLTAFARIRASTNYVVEEPMGVLRNLLRRLNAAKCDDPMVRYLHTRFIFSDTHSTSEKADELVRVATAMGQSEYPDIRKFYAYTWAYWTWQQENPRRPDVTNLLENATSCLAKAFEDPGMPALEAEQSCDFLMSTPRWAYGTRWQIYKALEPVLTNRWRGTSFGLLAKGRAYLSYGWQARGTGYANTVTDTGWQKMADRLRMAADALEAAWNLNPHDARICREMMRVELGQGQGRDRLEKWFQRGMHLNPGDYDLCYEKLEYLRPRWYGSMTQMIDFGRECTMNTNWTGGVRLMLANAYYEASRETPDPAQRQVFFQQTNIWPDIHFTFEQFFKLYPEEIGYRHNYALFAVRCEQWQEFLNQAKLFAHTNYDFFGGLERFNRMLQVAEEKTKKK